MMNVRTTAVLGAMVFLATACSDGPSPTPVAPSPEATIEPTVTSQPTLAATSPPTTTPSHSPTPVPPTATPTFVPEPVILPTVTVPLPLPRRQPTDPLSGILDVLGDRASLVRSLFAREPVAREFVTREDLSTRILTEFEEELEDVLKFEKLYKTLGILDHDESLLDILVAMYSEGVLGFFDTEEERLYMVSEDEDLGPKDQSTYVHEYIHGLQQQHYDINTTFEELEQDTDKSLAFRGLIEGDASVSEMLYMFQYMDDEEEAEARAPSPDSSFEAFRAAPHVIQRTFTFPYVEGFQFVVALFTAVNDWDLVDEAYTAPPQSTEQVIHPEKYLVGEGPVAVELPDLVEGLGEGWSQILTDSFGEFFIQVYLEMYISPERASLAATGWGGDRFSLLKSGDETLLYALIDWDGEDHAMEFFDAFLEFTQARTGLQWGHPAEDDTQRLMSLQGQVIFLDLTSSRTLLIFAPDTVLLEAARSPPDGA